MSIAATLICSVILGTWSGLIDFEEREDLQIASIYRDCGSGGPGGSDFSDDVVALKGADSVTEVIIYSTNYIDGIQLRMKDRKGNLYEKEHHGAKTSLNSFILQDDEFIVAIEGRYAAFVDSITIKTNFGRSETFGGAGGNTPYSLIAPTGFEIVGLCGRKHRVIDAIGIVARERE